MRPLLLLLVAVVLATAAGPALAIGAPGVDLRPLLERRDGVRTATVTEEGATSGVRLHNDSEQDRTGSVTTAHVSTEDGQRRLGEPVAWLLVEGAEGLVLTPGESRELAVPVEVDAYLADGREDVALVLVVQGEGNVVTQAATVIRVTDGGAVLPRPVELILLATVLLAVVALALVVVARLQGHDVRSVWDLARRTHRAQPAAWPVGSPTLGSPVS